MNAKKIIFLVVLILFLVAMIWFAMDINKKTTAPWEKDKTEQTNAT